MNSPVSLFKLAEVIQIDNHYSASVQLAYAFRELNIKKIVIFCHEKDIEINTLESISFRGKNLPYLVLDDNCVFATTYNYTSFQTTPSFLSRLFDAAKFFSLYNRTQLYLKYASSLGYFIDDYTADFVLRWIPAWDRFYPEYTGKNIPDRPLARLAIHKKIFL